MFSEEEVIAKIESHQEFLNYVERVFSNYILAKNGNCFLDSDTINFSDDKVHGEGDEYWRYGGHEHYHYSMPVSMLWQPDLAAAMADERREEEEAKRKLEEARRKREAEANIEREKSELRRLQAKYGGQ